MGKPKRERDLEDTEAQAITRNIRVSPRKLNLVAALMPPATPPMITVLMETFIPPGVL